MTDRCYFKGPKAPEGWNWTKAQGGWQFTCDQTPDAGGIPLSITTPLRHEPAFWIEGETLFAQRDRPGRYPFAWLKNKLGVFVSSDVEFLQRIAPVSGWNIRQVAQTLSLYDDPGVEDCRPGVFRLRPGERGTFTHAGLEQCFPYPRYIVWKSEESSVEAIEGALKHVCDQVPKHPTILLSGGVDSTTLAALLVATGAQPGAATLTSRFESQNEETVVRSLCKELKIPLHTFSIDDVHPFDTPAPWTHHTGYGFGLYPDMVYLFPFLRFLIDQGATHFVSGFGADQLFSVSPHRIFEEGIQNRDLDTCQSALDLLSARDVAGAGLARLRPWRRLRTKPSWSQLEFWLSQPIHTTPVPTLNGWWYERSMRGVRLQEKSLNTPIFTPYCSAELMDVVESIDPKVRMAFSNKYLLRLVALNYLPKTIAIAPKTGLFTEYWEHELRRLPLSSLSKRLDSLTPLLGRAPISPKLLKEELSNVASQDSTCYNVINAICVADVLNT